MSEFMSQLFAPNLIGRAVSKSFSAEQHFDLLDGVGLVLSGVIAEDIESDRGYGSMTLRLAGPNTLINLSPILRKAEDVTKRFVCETPTANVAVITSKQFSEAIRTGPPESQIAAAQELLFQYDKSIFDIEETCRTLRVGTLEERVVWALRRYRDACGDAGISIRKRRLAAHIGAAVETVSRTLTSLEEEGMLYRKGPHEIYLHEDTR